VHKALTTTDETWFAFRRKWSWALCDPSGAESAHRHV